MPARRRQAMQSAVPYFSSPGGWGGRAAYHACAEARPRAAARSTPARVSIDAARPAGAASVAVRRATWVAPGWHTV
eukprot:1421202-Alexandrium_andersonii.AAC.1